MSLIDPETVVAEFPFDTRCGASLLRRLAQAVDGFRGGGPVVFVGRYAYSPADSGHALAGPFHDREEARTFIATNELNESDYGIFGPFDTKRPGETEAQWSWANGEGLDTVPGGDVVGPTRVAKVHVEMSNGETVTLNGRDFDSVFWSDSARDKFLVPYYVAIGSLEEGVMLRDNTDEHTLIIHRPGSVWGAGSAVDPTIPESAGYGPAGAQQGVGLYGISFAGGSNGPTWVARPLG